MNMRIFLIIVLIFTYSVVSFGQQKVIPLWSKGAIPNQHNSNEKEITIVENVKKVKNVQEPNITVYLAPKENASDISVVICPGGGYGNLAIDYEGTNVALWLNSKGINAFVLKYRLPNSPSLITPYKVPLQDIQQALKIIKSKASEFHINSNKVGVLGFSAGGHLAATSGTHFSTDEEKPNFMALIYPVISMQDGITHYGSRKNLLGKSPSEELINYYSNELQVTSNTPPTFIVHATNDKIVPVDNSILFYNALIKNNIPVEMHIYPKGGHGFAFGENLEQVALWPALFYNWLINLN
jgi:acetyl esterase/lipase